MFEFFGNICLGLIGVAILLFLAVKLFQRGMEASEGPMHPKEKREEEEWLAAKAGRFSDLNLPDPTPEEIKAFENTHKVYWGYRVSSFGWVLLASGIVIGLVGLTSTDKETFELFPIGIGIAFWGIMLLISPVKKWVKKK